MTKREYTYTYDSTPRYKLIFFVPTAAAEAVKGAVFAAGGGTFPGGKYMHCSFETAGTGQFQPVAERGAKPAIGQLLEESGTYRLERVPELKCEIMCVGRGVLVASVQALKKSVLQPRVGG